MNGMLKFLKLDIRKSTTVWVVLFFIEAIILFTLVHYQSIVFAFYLSIMEIHMVTIIICLAEECTEVGFVELLPGTQKQKIIARFFYGAVIAMFGNVTLMVMLFLTHTPKQILGYIGFSIFFCIGMELMILAIQYMMFYKTARKKSKMVSVLATFSPGCLMTYIYVVALIVSFRYSNAKLLMLFKKVVVFGPLVCLGGILFYIVAMQKTIHFMKEKDLL